MSFSNTIDTTLPVIPRRLALPAARFASIRANMRSAYTRYVHLTRTMNNNNGPAKVTAREKAHQRGLVVSTSAAQACPQNQVSVKPLPIIEVVAIDAVIPQIKEHVLRVASPDVPIDEFDEVSLSPGSASSGSSASSSSSVVTPNSASYTPVILRVKRRSSSSADMQYAFEKRPRHESTSSTNGQYLLPPVQIINGRPF